MLQKKDVQEWNRILSDTDPNDLDPETIRELTELGKVCTDLVKTATQPGFATYAVQYTLHKSTWDGQRSTDNCYITKYGLIRAASKTDALYYMQEQTDKKIKGANGKIYIETLESFIINEATKNDIAEYDREDGFRTFFLETRAVQMLKGKNRACPA